MWRRTGPLLQRASATLGLALLLPGAVMLVWGSPGAGARPLLHASASGLCAAGAGLLLAAVALSLGLGQRPQPGPQQEAAGQDQRLPGARTQPGLRPRQLLRIPSSPPAEAEAPPTIWTVSGGLEDEPPPPVYDTVVVVLSGGPAKLGGPRRSVSESEAADGLRPPPPCSLEPLTPPPCYDATPSATVFCFPPASPGL